MIQLVMKPDYGAGIVNRETLYKCLFNGEDIGLRVRGLKAAHAEEKIMEVFRHELKGKEINYDLEAYRRNMAGSPQESQDGNGDDAKEVEAPMLPGME